ncbi:MAG: hypothetical protein ACYDAZ_01730 [Thermoplasmataceae archaeon]
MSVKAYIAQAQSISHTIHTGVQLPMAENETEVPFVADPLSMVSVSINSVTTGKNQLQAHLSGLGTETKRINVHDSGVPGIVEYDIVMKSETDSSPATFDEASIEGSFSREQAINLLVYLNLVVKGGAVAPVSVDEAVFSVKNEMALPDDFVPAHLMDMVEGRKISDPGLVMERINNLPAGADSRLIFGIARENNRRFLAFDSLFCVKFKGDAGKMYEAVFNCVKSDFALLEESEKYDAFVLSRLLKQISYNLSRGRKIDLSSPAYGSGKREILIRNGFTSDEGGVTVLDPGLDADRLESLRLEFLSKASALAKKWLSGMMEIRWNL